MRAGFVVYTADKIISATGTKRKCAETDDEGTDHESAIVEKMAHEMEHR